MEEKQPKNENVTSKEEQEKCGIETTHNIWYRQRYFASDQAFVWSQIDYCKVKKREKYKPLGINYKVKQDACSSEIKK